MKFKSRFFLFFIYLAFVLCLLPIAIFTYKHPEYNWDMLGYMALVVRMDKTKNIEEIHHIVYDNARQMLPADKYEQLTGAFSFREKFATDPLEFQKLLPIYIVKPIYIWMCRLFYKGGFPLPLSTVLPSIISYIAIGLFLLFWLSKYFKIGVAFLASLLVMLSVFSVNLAALSTPDCVSAFFFFTSIYFILEKQNLVLMFLLFLLAIFTRVDNVITCFFIISFLAFSRKWKRINSTQYFVMAAILGIAYIIIMLPVRQFGWNIFFYSQYARHISFAGDFDKPLSAAPYISLMYSKLVTALVSSHFTFFLFLGLVILGNAMFSCKKLTFDQTFLLLLLFIIFFRFLLLPDLSDRFLFGFYLIFIILLVRKFSKPVPLLYRERG